jgi:hypothetical protein
MIAKQKPSLGSRSVPHRLHASEGAVGLQAHQLIKNIGCNVRKLSDGIVLAVCKQLRAAGVYVEECNAIGLAAAMVDDKKEAPSPRYLPIIFDIPRSLHIPCFAAISYQGIAWDHTQWL